MKNDSAKLLLVPEPANTHDPNAIAVLCAAGLSDDTTGEKWVWTHVGYIERGVAAAWSTGWAHSETGELLVVEAEYIKNRCRAFPTRATRSY